MQRHDFVTLDFVEMSFFHDRYVLSHDAIGDILSKDVSAFLLFLYGQADEASLFEMVLFILCWNLVLNYACVTERQSSLDNEQRYKRVFDTLKNIFYSTDLSKPDNCIQLSFDFLGYRVITILFDWERK